MKPIQFSSTRDYSVSPSTLWEFLSDTDRLNKTIGLPNVTFVPYPDPTKKGFYRASISLFGLKIEYEEFPFDWVEGRYYNVVRRFSKGPFVEVKGGINLEPTPNGTRLTVFADIVPRNIIGVLVAYVDLKKKAVRDIFDVTDRYINSIRVNDKEALFKPCITDHDIRRTPLKERLSQLGDKPVEKDLIPFLENYLLCATDLDVTRMRPFEIADEWQADRIDVLSLFLYATRCGLVDLIWNIICPNCRAPSQSEKNLDEFKSKVHCDTCNIGYGTDFSKSVEVIFRVNPAIRQSRNKIFCIGGPANMPDIMGQFRVAPGAVSDGLFHLKPGRIRIRSYQVPGLVDYQVLAEGDSGELITIRFDQDGIHVPSQNFVAGDAPVQIENKTNQELLVVVERETWFETAATGAMVIAFNQFRDLFPEIVVAPGSEISVSNSVFLFTDLKGSTAMYERMGDSRAFEFVQSQFQYLIDIVAEHEGAIVKTMGDAIMATFASARAAAEAAWHMQLDWNDFLNREDMSSDVQLKVGVHQGPSFVINNKGRLDYFGTTINLSARVQGQSTGGDIVFSQAMMSDPTVSPFVNQLEGKKEKMRASLKGIKEEQELFRVIC